MVGTGGLSIYMKKLLIDVIEKAQQLSLPIKDIENSREFLKYNEYELCLDTIATQLYEYGIKIDREFYNSIIAIFRKMNIDSENYNYLTELLEI